MLDILNKIKALGPKKDHKQWLYNEYNCFIKSLQASTPDNFAKNKYIRRMLGMEIKDWFSYEPLADDTIRSLSILHSIGGNGMFFSIRRMIHYAQRVLKQNPTSICEIGGGVGQFYAVLRALGYKGTYYIYDLPAVKGFQRKYLDRVTELTGLNTALNKTTFDFCCSFYALGEFDDEAKNWYINYVVKKCPHGLIAWNPHAGASQEINFECYVEDEIPQTGPNNKILSW